MKLYDHITTAKKYAGQNGVSLQETCSGEDKTQFALKETQRLREASPKEDKPVQLAGQPVPN